MGRSVEDLGKDETDLCTLLSFNKDAACRTACADTHAGRIRCIGKGGRKESGRGLLAYYHKQVMHVVGVVVARQKENSLPFSTTARRILRLWIFRALIPRATGSSLFLEPDVVLWHGWRVAFANLQSVKYQV